MRSFLLGLSNVFIFLLVLTLGSAACPEKPPAMSVLSKIGAKLLEYAADEAFPSQLSTNLTREVNEVEFRESVCSYFEHYHRFYWRLRHLWSQNDTEQAANTSLLTFLLKKSTKSSCNKFRSTCAGPEMCSNLDCNMNSIATLCLGLPTKAQLVDFLRPPVQIPTEGRPTLVQLWMQLNLSSKDLSSGLFDSLARVLEVAGFIRCTAPPSNGTATVDMIRCSFVDLL